jgi:phage FluMu protein gp41
MNEKVALSFDLRLRSIPIVMTVEDDKKVEYTLKELNGKDRDAYMQDMRGRMEKGSDRINNFVGMQAALLSKSLFDENGTAVSTDKVQKLPSSMLNKLFSEAQDLSDIGADDDEEMELAKDELVEAALSFSDPDDKTVIDTILVKAKKVSELNEVKND